MIDIRAAGRIKRALQKYGVTKIWGRTWHTITEINTEIAHQQRVFSFLSTVPLAFVSNAAIYRIF